MSARTYLAIDLKSFYASVECVERGKKQERGRGRGEGGRGRE